MNLIVRVPMRAHKLIYILGKDKVAYLRSSVDAINHFKGQCVPESNRPIRCASSSGQSAMLMRVPCDSFYCSFVSRKLPNGVVMVVS